MEKNPEIGRKMHKILLLLTFFPKTNDDDDNSDDGDDDDENTNDQDLHAACILNEISERIKSR